MSGFDQELQKIKESVVVPAINASSEPGSVQTLNDEKRFYEERHKRDMADRDTAREQRQAYAKYVFFLVFGWITAIYILLMCQVFGRLISPLYSPLSDKVLLALISSTTVNLIGTLIIVLKYIFRIPNAGSDTQSGPGRPKAAILKP